jgi:hypothetical protein
VTRLPPRDVSAARSAAALSLRDIVAKSLGASIPHYRALSGSPQSGPSFCVGLVLYAEAIECRAHLHKSGFG